MEIDMIYLTKAEQKRLRFLSKQSTAVPAAPNEKNLVEHALVSHNRYSRTSEDPPDAPTLYTTITDKGRQYLLFVANRRREKREDHTHNWLIAIFSAISGALLSEPVWAVIRQICDWLSDKP